MSDTVENPEGEMIVEDKTPKEPAVFDFIPEDGEAKIVLTQLRKSYNEEAFGGVFPSFFENYVMMKCMEAESRPVDQLNKRAEDIIEAYDKYLLLLSMGVDGGYYMGASALGVIHDTILRLDPYVRESWESYKKAPERKDEIIGRQKEQVLFGIKRGGVSETWYVLATTLNKNHYGILRSGAGHLQVFVRYHNSEKNNCKMGGFLFGTAIPILETATEEDVCNAIRELMIHNGEANVPSSMGIKRQVLKPS